MNRCNKFHCFTVLESVSSFILYYWVPLLYYFRVWRFILPILLREIASHATEKIGMLQCMPKVSSVLTENNYKIYIYLFINFKL